MSKKKAKKLRKQHLANFEEWLDERSPEELARLRVTMGVTKATFRAVVERSQETLGETAS